MGSIGGFIRDVHAPSRRGWPMEYERLLHEKMLRDAPIGEVRECAYGIERLSIRQVVRDRFAFRFSREADDYILAEAEGYLATFLGRGTLSVPDGWREGLREAWRSWLSKRFGNRNWSVLRWLMGREPRYVTYEAIGYLPNLDVPKGNHGDRFRVTAIWERK